MHALPTPFARFAPIAVLACALAWAPLADAADRRLDRSKLDVMTLNTEFLWDGIPPEVSDATFPHKGDRAKAYEHMRRVSEIILKADADIVNLCEVEDLHALSMLNETFLKGRGYRAYLERGSDSSTGQNMGLLTRIDPMDGRIVYDARPGTSGKTVKSLSKDYVATFAIGGLKLGVLGLHLRAQPLSRERKPIRQAQADAAAQIARELSRKGYSVIVLGDLNDFDGSPEALDNLGDLPITDVLAKIRAMDPAVPGDDLVNAASFLPREQRSTCFWDKNRNDRIDGPEEFSSIDHLLLSPDLARRVERVRILKDHDPREVTDHFPIVVRLRCDRPRHHRHHHR